MSRPEVVIVGRCRYCGCTDLSPCVCPDTGLPCSWLNAEHTVCDNVPCIARVPIAELEQFFFVD